jgi:hypothetical protein
VAAAPVYRFKVDHRTSAEPCWVDAHADYVDAHADYTERNLAARVPAATRTGARRH